MTPVYQDRFGSNHGNCKQAAVASLLGLDLHTVPDLQDDGTYANFLQSQGFIEILLPPNARPDCYYMATGPNKANGNLHAVVARAGRLIFDPHPGRNGLRSVDRVHLLVPIEIALGA